MSNEILSLLINSSGETLVTGLFLWYLQKKQKYDNEIFHRFNETIQNHLRHANKLQSETNGVNKNLAIRLQELTDVITSLDSKINSKKRIYET